MRWIPDHYCLCPTCDAWYDPNGEYAAEHKHPEPQSGPPREALIAAVAQGLDYERWIVETPEGREWNNRKRFPAPAGQPNTP